MEEFIIEKTVSSLKKRLASNNNILILQLEEGNISEASCTFYDPISEDTLTEFSNCVGHRLPDDYVKFLRLSNGCRLFDHPYYGGENYLYGLQEIFHHTYEEPSDGYLKIGYFYQENIFIDLKLFVNGEKNYLFVKEHISQFSEGRPLYMNFELWFDRFVISQGTKFWNYPIYTAETYYTAR